MAGLEVQVVVAALGLQGPTVDLVTQALTVVMGVAVPRRRWCFPSFLRVFLSRKEDVAFRRAIGELVSAGDSRDVAEHLLPHVCALVGRVEGGPPGQRRHGRGPLSRSGPDGDEPTR